MITLMQYKPKLGFYNMNKIKLLLLVVLIYSINGCDILNNDDNSFIELEFNKLYIESVPPCLNYAGIDAEFVIRKNKDYDNLKIIHAPQGEYEDFIADGVRKNFKLSYQPLDADLNGKIGPEDLIIYMSGEPIYVNYNGNTIKVNSYPFYIKNNQILIFNDSSHIVEKTIPYQLVFKVDTVSGEIFFISPPHQGNKVSFCASRKLYSSYQGRDCNMNYFNFTKYSIIGKQVTGNGCLKDFNFQLLRDDINKEIIFQYKLIEEKTNGGCPEVLVTVTHWIYTEKFPDGYNVVFKQIN
jgi:hypothetical protein